MNHAAVGRWGKNLAVRFPQDIASLANPREGERVEIEAQQDTIVIRRAQLHVTLEELFVSKSADEWRALYADAYDWGLDVGRKFIEE
jgi:antitoxin MazE